jgi:hypothetical protein
MVVPDSQVACLLAVQHDPVLHSEEDRVANFTAATGASRATYFRLKAKLSRAL